MPLTHYTQTPSPVGPLLLIASPTGISGLHMQGDRHGPAAPSADWQHSDTHPLLQTLKTQLDEYFHGIRKTFDIRLDLRGTDFQRSVWQALCTIPYGTTISYGQLAQRIANPRAVRAVGLANGRNPVSIIVPCHRVIGANGSLTGYGGGLANKRILLELEAR